MTEPKNILGFWQILEFFSPCWPIKIGDDYVDLLKKEVPWLAPLDSSAARASYDIYLGCATSDSLTSWLLNEAGVKRDSDTIEKDNSRTCICALKVSPNGQYVPGSFALSSFAWATARLAKKKSLRHKLDGEQLREIQENINEDLNREFGPSASPEQDAGSAEAIEGSAAPEATEAAAETISLTKDDLLSILRRVCRKIKLPRTSLSPHDALIEETLWAHKSEQVKASSEANSSTELMQSFYLKDIERVRGNLTDNICHYIQAMEHTDINRVYIDTNVDEMKACLHPGFYPLGAWPSPHSPSLMQQIGINLAITGEQRIFSVNGPPGTGKTTLLKEIVASNIVNRAVLMAAYKDPDSAFKGVYLPDPASLNYRQSKFYYQLNEELSQFGILVASNNNAAVENISTELPKSIEKDRTGRFSDTTSDESGYFADVASAYLGAPAWGLISAALGKGENLKKVVSDFWFGNATIKSYLKTTTDKDADPANKPPDWETAKKNFTDALKAVRDARAEISHAVNLLSKKKLSKLDAELVSAQTEVAAAKTEYSRRVSLLSDAEKMFQREKEQAAAVQGRIEELEGRIPWYSRILGSFFSLNGDAAELAKLKAIPSKVEDCERDYRRQQTETSCAKEVIETAEQKVLRIQEQICEVTSSISEQRTKMGDNWAEGDFWNDITHNEKSQAACPWTNPAYDELREELFYQALMLHKAFVLNSAHIIRTNLSLLVDVWKGKASEENRKAAYAHLLNTFMLIVPVVSTTFAAAETFLRGVKANQLGWLIIDEAGQATPQSALGCIWRAKKTIVVGDPLQVEPTVTVPKELYKLLADQHGIPSLSIYRERELSVQRFADHVNRFGGVRRCEDSDIWLGSPLIVHRRCIEPMFTISNRVAYNSRMFRKTSEPDPSLPLLFKKSAWLDCQGPEKGDKNHTVESQIDVAAELVERAIGVYEGLPNLYIITPFTSVARSLKERLRKVLPVWASTSKENVDAWLKENCGTIHTFQGKEAGEVLLVLGCDAENGKLAAEWVGASPNIINVAVSRAKYRLVAIGDYELWSTIPHVWVACEHLERCSDVSSLFTLPPP